MDGFLISICQNEENYGTDILVYLEAMRNCQNLNLTTTQPQPNLNLVGFDMIITLHPPTTTTGTLILPEGMVLEV